MEGLQLIFLKVEDKVRYMICKLIYTESPIIDTTFIDNDNNNNNNNNN